MTKEQIKELKDTLRDLFPKANRLVIEMRPGEMDIEVDTIIYTESVLSKKTEKWSFRDTGR